MLPARSSTEFVCWLLLLLLDNNEDDDDDDDDDETTVAFIGFAPCMLFPLTEFIELLKLDENESNAFVANNNASKIAPQVVYNDNTYRSLLR